jgi:hypothetical protein
MRRGIGGRRGPALAIGAALAVASALGAWVSGTLDPEARRPILDGAGQVSPYRWVHPPPDLAAGNQRPDSGDFTIALKNGTSAPGAFPTNDLQVHLLVSQGAFPPSGSATAIHLTVTPLDPATLSRPPGYSILGNVYRVRATYQPGGQAVGSVVKATYLTLAYPAIVTHSLQHLVLESKDGRTWTTLKSNDDLSTLRATAPIRSFGYFAAGVRGGLPSPSPSGGGSTGGRRRILPWIVIGIAALIAIALVVTRGGTSSPRGEHEGRGGRPRGGAPRSRGAGRHERPGGGGRRR